MTLTRPAYQVTVTNQTAGWSYTTTQHDTSTLDDPVQLADGLTMGWSFADGHTPGQLDPDQVTFKLFCESADAMPSMTPGDRIVVDLVRPRGVFPPIPYMRFTGRMSDPEAEPVRKRGFIVTVTATGHLASLAGTLIGDRSWPQLDPFVTPLVTRYERIAQLARINLDTGSLNSNSFSFGAMDVDARSAYDLLVEAISCHGNDAAPPLVYVLRASTEPVPPAGPDSPYAIARFGDDDVLFVFDHFTLQQGTELGYAPYALRADGLVATLEAQPPDELDPRILSAQYIEFDVGWRKDKADAVNRIVMTGIAPANDTDANVTLTAEHPDLIRTYGPNPRTITTMALNPRSVELGLGPARWLPAHDDAVPAWSVDKLTVLTEQMTDADLDRLAPTFFAPVTAAYSTQGRLARRVIIPDVDEQFAAGGVAVTGHLTGVEFNIAGGELTIVPTIRNEGVDPETFIDPITWNTLAAKPVLEGTTWTNAAALHIDPDLTWRDIALSTI